MFKKILTIFIILLLWVFNLLGYVYDNLVISYDINNSSNLKIVNLSLKDRKLINTVKKQYNFSDGSATIVSIKWLKLSKSKIDFITNYKWILNNFVNPWDDYYKNKDLSPKRVYDLTASISNTKHYKEKAQNSIDILMFVDDEYIITWNIFDEFILNKSPILLNTSRWPPIYYIFNEDIIC